MAGDWEDAPLDGSVGAGFDEYLFYLITHVYTRRVRDFTPMLEAFDLSIAHWRALSTMNRLDGCLMTELAEFSSMDRTTLTRTVDQLVEMGLVERQTSRDRRMVRVSLTDAGRERFACALDRLLSHNTQILSGLSSDELKTLRGLLQRLLRNLISDKALFAQVLQYARAPVEAPA